MSSLAYLFSFLFLKEKKRKDGPGSHSPAPLSVSHALQRPDAEMWRQAMWEEIESCLAHDTWECCELPCGKKALPSRFVFDRKQDGRYKARLVAGGHRQQHGLDFHDIYAPTCSYRTLRMLLAVSAKENLEFCQFDIHTAFLNEPI
jgi:hypothetical protein